MGAYLLWSNTDTPITRGGQDINSLFFDVIMAEEQEKGNTITEHPVEQGSNVTDHVRPNLDRVTIEGLVSQKPLFADNTQMVQEVLNVPSPPGLVGLGGLEDAIAGAISRLVTGPQQFTANVMEFPNGAPDFVGQVMQVLEQLRTNATLVAVVCPNYYYDNMLIENVSLKKEPGNTSGRFTIELREIRMVASSITAAPQPTIPRAQVQQATGSQSTQVPDEAKSSHLNNLFGDKF